MADTAAPVTVNVPVNASGNAPVAEVSIPVPATPSGASPTGTGAKPVTTGVPMDPTVAAQLLAGWGIIAQGQVLDNQHATARQRDAAHTISAAVQGTVAKLLVEAGDPAFSADLNTMVRTPTTLDHPSIPVTNPANTGKTA